MSIARKAFNLSKTKFGELVVGLAFEKFSSALPVKKVYNDQYVIAFWHPRPNWEKHIVIVPKKAIASIEDVKEKHQRYITAVHIAAPRIVKDLGWPEYTVSVNGGKLQHVKQIHFHLYMGKMIG